MALLMVAYTLLHQVTPAASKKPRDEIYSS
jgi:hypothetical protein